MPFIRFSALPAREVFPQVHGHYAHLSQMSVGEVELAANVTVPLHQHKHEQITHVLSGRFEFTIGDQTTVLEPGMAALIPGGTLHGGKTLTACRILDIFSPVREEYR